MNVTGSPLVVLLRHGETAWNVEQRFQGQHDTDLSVTGREQARAAATAIARAVGERDVRVVSSDLARARATASAVADDLRVKVRTDPRLREVAAGSWQGLLQPEIEALDPDGFAGWRSGDDVVLGGAERPSEAGARVAEAVLDHASGLGGDEWLLAVGHGASIRAGLSQLLGQPDLRRVLVPLGNTGVAVLSAGTVVSQPWRLHGWNVPPSALQEVLSRRPSRSATLT